MERLLLREEAAELIRKPVSWLRYAEKRKRIPFVRVGQQIRYRTSDLVTWLEANTVYPDGPVELGDGTTPQRSAEQEPRQTSAPRGEGGSAVGG